MGLDVLGGVGGGAVAGVSTGGNTAGNTGTVGNQIVLVGGANITLSEATAAGGLATVSIVGGGVSFSEGVGTGGNTAGTTGTVSNGVLLFGGNNITLSQSSGAGGATVSFIGNAGVGAFQGGVSTGGNTSGNTKTVASQIVFVGGNNVTLSQATNGASATITISGPTGGGAGMSTEGNTAGTTGTVGMELVFVGSRNITLSQSVNGSSGTLSILAPANILNSFSIGGNTGTTNSSAISGGGFVLAGGSNITLSQSNNSISIHGASGGTGGVPTFYQHPTMPVGWIPYPGVGQSGYSGSTSANGASTHSTMTYYVQPLAFDGNVVASDIMEFMKLTLQTGGSSTGTLRDYFGLYSLTSDSISLASSWVGGICHTVANDSISMLAFTGSDLNSINSGTTVSAGLGNFTGTRFGPLAQGAATTIPASQYFGVWAQHKYGGGLLYDPIYQSMGVIRAGQNAGATTIWLPLNGAFSSTSSTNVAGANQWLMPSAVATSAIIATNANFQLRNMIYFRGI